jgi:hypothetical protein
MLRTDFILTTPEIICTWTSFQGVMDVLEELEHWVGGNIYFPERLQALGRIFMPTVSTELTEVSLPFPTSARLYLLQPPLRDVVASSPAEALYDAAAGWANDPVWANTINSYDLAGMLVSFRALCREAQQKEQLIYLLVASDDEWLA